MGTVIEEDELVIPRDGCAFVWKETPEEPIEKEEVLPKEDAPETENISGENNPADTASAPEDTGNE